MLAAAACSSSSCAASNAEPRGPGTLFPLRLPDFLQPKQPLFQLPEGVQQILRQLQSWGRRTGGGSSGGSLRDDGCVPGDMVVELTADSEDWKLQLEKKGVKVWRRSVPGCKNDEVRGNGLIKAPPAAVLELIKDADEEIIRQYNPMYDRGYDLEVLDANTKVSYGSVRAIFPFKPRDTVTRVAFRDLPASAGAGTLVLQRAVKHASMPKRKGYVRAEILRGTFIVQPVKGSPGMTNFTFTQQINAGGILPAWLMNQLVAQDAVQLVIRLNTAAKRYAKKKR